MSNTFTKCHVHAVFSTKHRERMISEKKQPHLWVYVAGICKNHDIIPFQIGGVEDYIHHILLFHLPPKLALSKAILLIKSNSSKWMNEAGIHFAWQEGYGAFNVSASEDVKRYIQNQKEHHQRMSFQQEFIALLEKHGVDFDVKYVFD